MSAAEDRRDAPLILLVDDEPVMRVLARESLEQCGFRIAEAENGQQALEVFAELRPALVLLDVKMPILDGFETCQRLRESAAGCFTPVLMMTGLDDIAAIEQAYEAGATDFINKPINWVILGHRVEYMLRASQFAADLRESQAKLANAQRIAALGYWELDFDSGEMSYSREIYRILDVARSDLAGGFDALLRLIHPDDRAATAEYGRSLTERAEPGENEFRIVGPNKRVRCIRQQAEIGYDEMGRAVRATGTLQDISERRDAEEKIRQLADYDRLTGLPNRDFFLERLETAVVTSNRHGRMTAVLFFDLDRFKRINETLGHSAGDRFLCEVAHRLERCVRATDVLSRAGTDAVHLLSRFGGDEFVVLLSELQRIEDAASVARRLGMALREAFSISGQTVFASASIGISVCPFDGEDVETLVKNADAAMSFAKEQGGSTYRYYTHEMNNTALERLALETGLRKALERDELELFYQPQIEFSTGRVIAAEALVRWRHPEQGLLTPKVFIKLAEDTGLIVPLGEWVLRQACSQAKKWHDRGLSSLRMAVNLSSRQFERWGLAGTVATAIEDSGIEPALLDLELTESALMKEEDTIRALNALKEFGVRLSVDDFGTGYSSLSYLMRFPLDALKIDRSFMAGVPYKADQVALVDAIMAMARSLKLDLVAEGIETQEQLNFLRRQGCRHGQGFLFSEPLSAGEFFAFAKSNAAGDKAVAGL